MKKKAIFIGLAVVLTTQLAHADPTFRKQITASQKQKVLDTLNVLGGDFSPAGLNVLFNVGPEPKGKKGAGDRTGDVYMPQSFYEGNYKRDYCGEDGHPHQYTYARALAHEVGHTLNRNLANHPGGSGADPVTVYINDHFPESLVGPRRDATDRSVDGASCK